MAEQLRPPIAPRITAYMIRNQIVARLPEEMSRGARTLAVSFAIISEFLDRGWTDRHFVGAIRDKTIAPGFFSLDGSDDSTSETRELGSHRTYEFAELILNLQSVHGFEERAREFLTADKSKMEATFGEFQVAGLLYQKELSFRFLPKKTNPAKGTDYDFDVFRHEAATIHVEAKCKLEATDVSVKSVLSSLREAVDQVPRDGPATIFVKLPQKWHVTGELTAEDLQSATYRFFGTTGRVISVVYYTPFVTIEGGRLHVHHLWQEVENHRSRFRSDASSLFMGRRDMTRAWVHLMPIIEGR